tara:strand:+ start:656 stop:910 length:255 start_codon:yes stop_codon:yes gene_type:complete
MAKGDKKKMCAQIKAMFGKAKTPDQAKQILMKGLEMKCFNEKQANAMMSAKANSMKKSGPENKMGPSAMDNPVYEKGMPGTRMA